MELRRNTCHTSTLIPHAKDSQILINLASWWYPNALTYLPMSVSAGDDLTITITAATNAAATFTIANDNTPLPLHMTVPAPLVGNTVTRQNAQFMAQGPGDVVVTFEECAATAVVGAKMVVALDLYDGYNVTSTPTTLCYCACNTQELVGSIVSESVVNAAMIDVGYVDCPDKKS